MIAAVRTPVATDNHSAGWRRDTYDNAAMDGQRRHLPRGALAAQRDDRHVVAVALEPVEQSTHADLRAADIERVDDINQWASSNMNSGRR